MSNRKSVDIAGGSDDKKTEEKQNKLGKNINEIQKFFSNLKLTKHKIDCRWENGTPLRAKSKSPVDTERPEYPTPDKRRRKTIDSTYECKLLQRKMLERRSFRKHLKEDTFDTSGVSSSSTPSQNPTILVNGLERNVQKCQVDFRNLFSLLADYIKSEADESKKEFISTVYTRMNEKLSEMEEIIETLQENLREKMEMNLSRRPSVKFQD